MSERERVVPDSILPPSGEGRRLSSGWRVLPDLVKLVGRLLRDPRVPRRAKITLALAAAYAASPIDLIPDSIPFVGWADDILLLMLALESLIDRAGPELVREHWDGPGDVLELLRELLGMSRSVLPRRLTSMVDRLSG
jgi:uncharacterized membrane protein YkvA (DUF1232 family)